MAAFLLLSLLISSALARTILDLESELQASVPYNEIPLLCAQCALAGNENSGCWGSSEESAVKVSGCTDGSIDCFCAEDAQEDRAAYILDLAEKICIKAGTSSSASESLAVSAYEKFCNTTVPTATASKTASAVSPGSGSSSSTTSSTSPTTDPSASPTSKADPDPLHPAELAGIIIGSTVGFLALVVAVIQLIHWSLGGNGFLLFQCCSCGNRHG
ncbi:hypothetical protein MKZ38_009822 [Zalerion maritima]|uniref:Extracellular membrane protein CFEM domain-containing protein n=1 Tax=Zalerion maritima TaxID=339359 RepID=A0AAD5S663_9PEZI|nr:hypothetical protein MKZ38_009822 [Zalerion maritima]